MPGSFSGFLVLLCLFALVAEQAVAHIAFFSPKEMRELRDKEGRKDADRTEGGWLGEISPEEDEREIADQPVEIGQKHTSKKGHVGSAFGKMLQSIVDEREGE